MGGNDITNSLSASATTSAPSPSSRPPCPGMLLWPIPERGGRECVLHGNHGGDHRDALGYRWNDKRWWD